ncbi:GNAT family N-acetyltransferase [Pelomonas sp. P8]|uniref:GNAT family N-acetyltransferase n=2 Tax=Pelomonas cellulosilytica TaxID=2906762 RepID=A0ABS8Y2X0_9BURK|nr:GNAT family N-acetyltransferase [Pelomonas sp. P8]
MHLQYSTAKPEDAAECISLRARTRQNAISETQLRSIGITEENWAQAVRAGDALGHVCRCEGQLVGYCFGSRLSGEVTVLALLPEFENLGIGKELLSKVMRELVAHGHARLFLACSANPQSRSHGFYRHLGWRFTGTIDAHGDEVLELQCLLHVQGGGAA